MELHQNDKETISLKKIIVNYIRQWKLFVIAACISLVFAVLYLVFYPKTYEIVSRIKIQEDKNLASGGSLGLGEAAGLMKSFGLGSSGSGGINLDDEIATLNSNNLLKRVVLRLGLNVTYQEPFSFQQIYKSLPVKVVPDSVTRQNLSSRIKFKIDINTDGTVKLKMQKSGEVLSFPSLPAQLKTEEGVFDIVYTESSDMKKPCTLEVSVSPANWVAEDLSKSIVIDEFSKNANTLDLIYTDYEKYRGMDLLNTLMDEFNKNSDTIKKIENHQAMSFLEGRVAGVMQDLNTVERAIETYKLANKMTDIEYDVQFYTDAVKNLREKIIEIEAQSHIINMLNAFVNEPNNRYSLIPSMLSVGEGEKGGAITSYNEALIERERLIKSTKSDNPLSEISKNQIDKLHQSVVVTINNAKKSSQLVLSELKAQEKAIMDKMANVPTYEREYIDLKRQQEILQGVYLILLQKREEIALSLGHERDKGFVVDAAFVKYKPLAPRKLFAAIFMIIFTLFIPIIYLFCKEQLHSLIAEYKKGKYA